MLSSCNAMDAAAVALAGVGLVLLGVSFVLLSKVGRRDR